MTYIKNPSAKPTIWLDHVKTNEDSKGLDKVHNYVTDLFKVTTKDELSEDARAKRLDSAIGLKVNSLLIRSPMDEEMMLIHQISKVGGDLLNPTLDYFGLTGFGTSATPVRFSPKSILTINEVECPCWATIKAIKTPVALKAAKDATPSLSYFTNAIPISPFLTQVIAPLNSPSASEIFFLCVDACVAYDAARDTTDPPASATLKSLLPFMWAANLYKIKATPTSTQTSTYIQAKCKELHSTFLQTPASAIPTPTRTVGFATNPQSSSR